MILLHPELRDPTRRTRPITFTTPKIKDKIAMPRHVRMSPQDLRNIEAMKKSCNFVAADWSIHGYIITQDNRGIGEVRDTIWGFLSRRKVLLKARSQTMSQAAMQIRLKPGMTVQEFVRQEWGGGNSPTLNTSEIFYAWRCNCQAQTEVIYPTVDDLPVGVGYHHSCGHCGSAPLEVIAG